MLRRLSFCLVVGISALWAGDSHPPQVSHPGIATIDHDRVIISSKAFEKARSIIEERRLSYQNYLMKKEKELRALEAELHQKEGQIPEKDFLELRQDFERKVDETQKLAAEQRRQLDDVLYTFRSKVVDKAMEIIKLLCEERKIIMVVPKSQIIYAVDSLEMTDEVLKRLDEQLPHQEISIPSIEQQ
jgi:Skp family chaperone for outer membrane proteins